MGVVLLLREAGRTITKSGLRPVACTMLLPAEVVIGLAGVNVRSWRRMRRGRVTSTITPEVVMWGAVEGPEVVCRADLDEAAACPVVRGWDGEDI